MKQRIAAFFAILLVALCASCSKDVERTYWPTDDWQRATPESVGFSSEQILESLNSLDFDKIGLHSLLVIKNGYIILEAYRYPYGPETLHNLNSATKSFISTLYGIALDRKEVENVSSRVLDYFPETKAAETDKRKLAMTVEDLLTMRTGQNWIEYADPNLENSFDQMLVSGNWLEYFMGVSMVLKPGTMFDYNTGASHIISAIIQKTTGSTEAFAREHLFGPLGIREYAWKNDPQGVPAGGIGLSLRTRDFAKLGFLYLNGGLWDGERILSKKWIKKATAVHADAGDSSKYGYQWWLFPGGKIFYANGYRGQTLYVIPEHDLIVVTNACMDTRLAGDLSRYLFQSIQSSMISPNPLPENEPAARALRDACAALSLPPEEKLYTLPSRITEAGITAEFGPNDTGILHARFARSPEGTLKLELVYQDGEISDVAVPLEAGTDNRYRVSTVFFPESRFLFDEKPSPVACRVIDSDETHVAVEILPVGVVNTGPFVVNTAFDGSVATFTYMNRNTRKGKTVIGTVQ
jgi:CubicO group peptidase (beta-lactamase class C family)